MFKNLSQRFQDVLTKIGKTPSINEKDLDNTLREIRLVLLEADVNLSLTKDIIAKLKEDLLGKEIYRSISPKQVILKSLYDTLFNLLNNGEEIQLYDKTSPAYYMLVGLQGTGKTTTIAKLGHYLKNKLQKKVLLVSLDLSRLAAYNQLQTLCKNNSLDFFEYEDKNLEIIIKNVQKYAQNNNYNTVLLDTAGRLSDDEALMIEMQHIYKSASPKETLLVIDSSMGQISLNVAKSFHEKINLSGIIVSKADADTRGGAVLSCKAVTQVPIKFMGFGEKITDLEVFSAKKIVDRLLDQGDILSLVEKFEDFEEAQALKIQFRLEKGIFTMNDFKGQIESMNKLGGMSSLMGMIPGISGLKDKISQSPTAENTIKKHLAIINSMNKAERKKPSILNFSRKKRIAAGSGSTLQDINILLKQYDSVAKTMKQFKGGGLQNIKNMFNNGKIGSTKMDMKNIMQITKKVKKSR